MSSDVLLEGIVEHHVRCLEESRGRDISFLDNIEKRYGVGMYGEPPRKDPFAPVELAVTALLGFTTILLLIFGGAALVESALGHANGMSVATIGDPEACATVAPGEVPYGSSDMGGPRRRGTEGVVGLRTGDARSMTRQIEICLRRPTVFQKTAATVAPVGDMVFGLGGLILIRRTIVKARRDGLFSPATTARTRQLGWFVVGMTAVYPFIAAAGQGVVVAAAVRGVSWTSQLWHPHISAALLVVGLGVLTFARILGQAVPLQQEVDLTV